MSVAEATTDLRVEVKGRSLWADARRRFMHNKAAVGGLIVFVLIAITCFAAPFLGMRAQDDINWDMTGWVAPDMEQGYLFGSDANGRDLFVRTLYGGQVSRSAGSSTPLTPSSSMPLPPRSAIGSMKPSPSKSALVVSSY